MKVAIYPGSFNPLHEGHREVIEVALRAFDKVIIAVGINPEKETADQLKNVDDIKRELGYGIKNGCIEVVSFQGLLADYVREQNKDQYNIHAVVKGLRNTTDFEYEKTQQYWNSDLSIGIPTFYVIASKTRQHISSSAIRAINKLRKK